MQFLRTALWVVAAALVVAFIAINWNKAPVNLWPLEDGNYLHFRWPVGFIALIFFLLGFGPIWFIHRTISWRLNRRITALENSIRITAAAEPADSDPSESSDENQQKGADEP